MSKLLSREEEKQLIISAQAGDITARHRLILKNMGLPGVYARKCRKPDWLDYDDLVHEGVIGMNRAIDLFDVTRGLAFSTYAMIWIRQRVQRLLEQNMCAMHTPTHIYNRLGNVYKAKSKLKQRLDREPTTQELAGETGYSEEQIAETAFISHTVLSLDHDYGDSEDMTLECLLTSGDSFEDAVETRVWVAEYVAKLPDDFRDVITRCYGLNTGEPMTQADYARLTNLSREGVRKRHDKAIALLYKEMTEAV